MGRRILGLRENANNEVIYGELGWWTLRTRRDLLRLRYWKKLLSMKDSRLTKMVYQWERKQDVPNSWAASTKKLLCELDLAEYWEHQDTEVLPPEWNSIIWGKLQSWEESKWKESIDSKPRLRTYRQFKQKLAFEEYLNAADQKGRRQLARIRSGANRLRIEEGRAKRLPPEDRKCWFGCMVVEDERHFLLSCPVYSDLRQEVIDKVGQEEFNNRGLEIMMGTDGKELTTIAIKFVQKATARRTRLLRLRG